MHGDKLIDELRAHLADIAVMEMQSHVLQKKILAAAMKRHDDLQARMKALKPQALLDDDAGARYLAMADELGTVCMVMARSRQFLAEDRENGIGVD